MSACAEYGGGCRALADALGEAEPECCGSCHDDDEMGYSGLLEVQYSGLWYEVCCAMWLKVDE